jgi:hypothetical protein
MGIWWLAGDLGKTLLTTTEYNIEMVPKMAAVVTLGSSFTVN